MAAGSLTALLAIASTGSEVARAQLLVLSNSHFTAQDVLSSLHNLI